MQRPGISIRLRQAQLLDHQVKHLALQVDQLEGLRSKVYAGSLQRELVQLGAVGGDIGQRIENRHRRVNGSNAFGSKVVQKVLVKRVVKDRNVPPEFFPQVVRPANIQPWKAIIQSIWTLPTRIL